jgi:hypothetical protein
MVPHQPTHDLSSILAKTIQKWHVMLFENGQAERSLPHDFNKEIKTLLLAADAQTRVQNQMQSLLGGKPFWKGISFIHTPQNMIALAQKLGIEIKRTPHFSYVRDHFLTLPDGTVVTARSSPFLEQATLRTHSSNIYLNRSAATHTTNQFFNVWSGYTKSYDAPIYKEQEKFLKKPAQTLAHTYFEGGNLFILKNLQGTTKVLMGSDQLLQTFHILELEERPWRELAKQINLHPSYDELRDEIFSSLTHDQIKRVAEEMFAQDLLHQDGKSGLIPHKTQLDIMLARFYTEGLLQGNQPLKDEVIKQMMAKQAIHHFEYREQESVKYKTAVADYLTKLKITQGLIAQDLGIKAEDLHFITQLNYHLDLFLTPGPNHSLFLSHYGICTDFLEAIRQNADHLQLSEIDHQYLDQYIETSKKMDRELGGLIKEVEAQLTEAHFKVIPMPGSLLYESKTIYREFPMPSGGFNINFMNALTGWDPKTKHHYYITHGIQVGDRLGNLLMDAIALFLQHYVPDIEVYFIGRDPKNLSDFSEAMDWWNRLETQSGIHCTTFELDIS